eukprot:scaffold9182_cov101-Amphora_coffeaeformis.AAC.1
MAVWETPGWPGRVRALRMAVQMIWHSVSVAPRGIGRSGEKAWTRAVGAVALKAGNSGRVTVRVKSPQERATGLVPRAMERVSGEYLGMVVKGDGLGVEGGRREGRRRWERAAGRANGVAVTR